MNKLRNESNKGIIKVLIQLVTVLVIVGAVIFVVCKLQGDKEPDVTDTFISNKLEVASELTSAKMTYNGLIRYSDGNIPFLTKKAYTMTYRAVITAGIDLSEVHINVTNTTVEITVPAVEIQDISIDTDSIQYYDEKFALFNPDTKDDAIESINLAKQDVTDNGGVDELKTTAKNQTEVLLQGLFTDCIGNRELVINFTE